MSLLSDIYSVLKKVAMGAMEESKPCDLVFATVSGAAPLEITIDQKTIIPKDFLMLTDTINTTGLAKGDKVVILQAHGGQKFLILDKVVSAT